MFHVKHKKQHFVINENLLYSIIHAGGGFLKKKFSNLNIGDNKSGIRNIFVL